MMTSSECWILLIGKFIHKTLVLYSHCLGRLISIGLEFCGEGSSSLQESMRQQSLNYFKNYHRYCVFVTKETKVLCVFLDRGLRS